MVSTRLVKASGHIEAFSVRAVLHTMTLNFETTFSIRAKKKQAGMRTNTFIVKKFQDQFEECKYPSCGSFRADSSCVENKGSKAVCAAVTI